MVAFALFLLVVVSFASVLCYCVLCISILETTLIRSCHLDQCSPLGQTMLLYLINPWGHKQNLNPGFGSNKSAKYVHLIMSYLCGVCFVLFFSKTITQIFKAVRICLCNRGQMHLFKWWFTKTCVKEGRRETGEVGGKEESSPQWPWKQSASDCCLHADGFAVTSPWREVTDFSVGWSQNR